MIDSQAPSRLTSLWRDSSTSAWIAGIVCVLVGYASSVAVIFQAAAALGANPAQTASMLWALGLGMGLTTGAMALVYRVPIVTAWSTPGAALIAATAVGGVPIYSFAEGVGAFIIAAVLVIIVGASGAFERVIRHVPAAIASSMLAGVLLRFGMDTFVAMKAQPVLVLGMCTAYLLARWFVPRYMVIAALLAGLVLAGVLGIYPPSQLDWQFTTPVFTMPQWSWAATIGLAIPLWVVTMASQNAPGTAVLRASGYATPVSAPIAATGVATLLLAPFGAIMVNLAAISAAICQSPQSHSDPARRYVASVSAGVVYCIGGLMGAMVAGGIALLPKPLILAVAGLALLNTIANGLTTGLRVDATREAGIVTFLITASGVSFFGVGAAFWGLIGGVVVLAATRAPRSK